jgi:hypothetical protein
MFCQSEMKLGKQAARFDPRTLRLARYLLPGLPEPPDEVSNSRGIQRFGMFLNDQLGDCTIAAVAHAHQVWVLSQVDPGIKASIIMPDDGTVKNYYERWCGYNPQFPLSDQGGVELDILAKWKGEGFAGRKIQAYVSVDPHNALDVRRAIYLFGGLYIGLALPVSAQTQDVWKVVNNSEGEPGSWGGHAVLVSDYDPKTLTCITWGEPKRMSWQFFTECADEAYAVLAEDWHSPSGFDMETLAQDLQAVASMGRTNG